MMIARSWESWAAAAGLLAAGVMFWAKSAYFPGFPTFSSNFSGNGWDHVTLSFILGRLLEVVSLPRPAITFAVTVVLAAFSLRYLVVVILLSPLLAAHLLAVRDMLAHFPLHYVIPLLVIWTGHFLTAGYRAHQGRMRRIEAIVLLIGGIACSTPLFLALTQYPPIAAVASYDGVAVQALVAPEIDLPALAEAVASATHDTPAACASEAVAALVPDAFTPAQVIAYDNNALDSCAEFFMFSGERDATNLQLKLEAAGFVPGADLPQPILSFTQERMQ